MLYTKFNGFVDRDLGIRAVRNPDFPQAEEEIEEIVIAGRDEPLTRKKKTFKNIPISIPYDFVDRNSWREKSRVIMSWLRNIKDNKLFLSDDGDFFYKVKYAKTNIARLKNVGEFTVEYICSPYLYRLDGTYEIELSNNHNIYNLYDLCKPIYKIEGEGVITLIVNNKPCVINVGQSVTIDTDLQLCFKDNQMINLALRSGDIEDLYLDHGENNISCTGAKVTIIPNWRCKL